MASSFSISCMVIIGLSYFPSGGVKPEVAKSADKIPPPIILRRRAFCICQIRFLVTLQPFLYIGKWTNRIPAISHLYQRILSIIHYFRMVSSRLLVIITALLPCFRAFCTFFSAKCAIFSYFFRKLLLFFTKNIVFGGFLPVFCIFRHISVEIVQQRCI